MPDGGTASEIAEGIRDVQRRLTASPDKIEFSYFEPVSRQWIYFKATSVMAMAGGGVGVLLERDAVDGHKS